MLDELISFLKDKKILILGFGVEGQASYNFLRRHFSEMKIFIGDKRDISINPDKITKKVLEEAKKDLVGIQTGETYLDNLKDYDLILKTPGLSFKGKNISKFTNKIYTSIDLFLKYYNIVTVGVTGTKGKRDRKSVV